MKLLTGDLATDIAFALAFAAVGAIAMFVISDVLSPCDCHKTHPAAGGADG